MRLSDDDALARLAGHDHATLCTVHSTRGVDAVPVVYAIAGDLVGVPIDRVKPKSSGALQRERNLAADGRATLLAEHWDAGDWTRLWWVRATLRWRLASDDAAADALAVALAARYPQYRDHPFDRILVFDITAVTGWSAR